MEIKQEKGVVGWRTLHEVQPQDMQCSRVIRKIKSRTERGGACTADVGDEILTQKFGRGNLME